MRLLEDCQQFADRHRGRNVMSGPHWSLVIRFVKLFDYACQMEAALREIADQAGTNRNADWARRRAVDALKGGE